MPGQHESDSYDCATQYTRNTNFQSRFDFMYWNLNFVVFFFGQQQKLHDHRNFLNHGLHNIRTT